MEFIKGKEEAAEFETDFAWSFCIWKVFLQFIFSDLD